MTGWLRRLLAAPEPVEPEPTSEPTMPRSEAVAWSKDSYDQGKAFGYRLAVQELSEAIEAAKKLDLDFSKTDPFNRLTTRGRA